MVKWRIGGWIRQGNIGEEQKAAVSGSARRIIMDGPMLCRMDGDHVRARGRHLASRALAERQLCSTVWRLL